MLVSISGKALNEISRRESTNTKFIEIIFRNWSSLLVAVLVNISIDSQEMAVAWDFSLHKHVRYYLSPLVYLLRAFTCLRKRILHQQKSRYYVKYYETCQTQKPYVYLLKWDLFCIKYTRELEWRRVLNSVGKRFLGKIRAFIWTL